MPRFFTDTGDVFFADNDDEIDQAIETVKKRRRSNETKRGGFTLFLETGHRKAFAYLRTPPTRTPRNSKKSFALTLKSRFLCRPMPDEVALPIVVSNRGKMIDEVKVLVQFGDGSAKHRTRKSSFFDVSI